MFYIVCYATHNEKYFNILKKSCPNIIILGYGDKWINFYTKIHKILDFCKTKNPDDIICIIDGFDTIVLSSLDELLDKYKSLNYDIVFSKAMNPHNIFLKYTQDKIFGKCNDSHLNSGMHIGNVESIIKFWKNINYNDDDQQYASNICRRCKDIKIYIDINNELFYNYSEIDKIKILDKRLLINKNYPCIISAPGDNNINHILKKLGYRNLPNIKFNYNYRMKTYLKHFTKEILFILLSILILYFSKNRFLAISACFLLFLEFIQYELYVKHIHQKQIYKFIYLLLDLFHISIIYFVYYLFLNFNCDIKKLLLLNIIYMFILLLFFYFKRCVLTILENKILGVDSTTGTISAKKRLNYFFDINEKYKPFKGNNMAAWIEGSKITITLIFILNIYCLTKKFKLIDLFK
jgi:hypothetical protein